MTSTTRLLLACSLLLLLAPSALAQSVGPCKVSHNLLGVGTSVTVRCAQGDELLFANVVRSFDGQVPCTVRVLGDVQAECPGRPLLP